MTLATILCLCSFFSGATGGPLSWPARSSPQQSSTPNPADASTSQPQEPAPKPAEAATTQTKPTQPKKPSPTKTPSNPKKSTKRKTAKKTPTKAPNCPPTVAGTAPASTETAPPPAGATPNKVPPPADCPPQKTVVHNGGTTEPAVQLVGGASGEQASNQRDSTDQLLGSTENNLKKMSGRQLDSNQQEMMTQIQQYIEQAKSAVASGDLERAHNLATKAQLLSDELVKP
jgi:hypothetical protein